MPICMRVDRACKGIRTDVRTGEKTARALRHREEIAAIFGPCTPGGALHSYRKPSNLS